MAGKSIGKNAVLNTLRTILSLVIPFITFPYTSRILLADNLGKVQFASSIVSYFGVIAILGLNSYGVREIAKIRDSKFELNKLVRELFIINTISTLIAYLLLGCGIIFIPKLYEFRLLILICSLNIIFATLGIDWMYSGLEEYSYITIRSVIMQILGVIFLFAFVKTKDDYLKYAFISVISCAGSGILNFIHSFKYLDFKLRIKLELKKHLKPLFFLFAYSIASSIFTLLDTSMLGFISNTEQVGYYSAAVKIVRMVRDIFPAAFTVVFPQLTYQFVHNAVDEYNKLIKKVLNLICLFAFPMSLGLCILIDTILVAFCGITFTPAIPVARVLAPLILCSAISGFLGGGVLLSQSKDKTYLLMIISVSIFAFFMNLIFIPLKQAFGAALATVFAELFIVIFYLFYFSKLLKEIHFFKDILHYILATLIMGIVVYIIHLYVSVMILDIVLSIISGIAVYLIILLILQNPYLVDIWDFVKSKKNSLKK